MNQISNNFKYIMVDFIKNCSNYQTVRWARKPIWMPTAKSKIFRVPTRPTISIEEKEELKRLYNNYRTQMKSIREFLTKRYNVKYQKSLDPIQIEKEFDEDFIRCNEINNKWNEEQKIIREKRVAEELAKDIEYAKNRLKLELKKKEENLEKAEEIVRREKEASKTFITPDKLDAAIEFALANPTDYNFAIDLEGNKIEGREIKPPL